ncbi:MAG: hypothetical protein K8I60_14930 [Anaerolineae bacterium]|nr:hypothetical protein [Anaerolineae bacterium]
MSEHNVNMDVEESFQASWLAMESFFAQKIIISGQAHLVPIYRFIFFVRNMRIGDYAFKLRAGQQVDRLVLSRSRVHGLRQGQPRLSIDVIKDSEYGLTYYNGVSTNETVVETLTRDDIHIDVQLMNLLDQLVEYPID